jgi:hypothetical protein
MMAAEGGIDDGGIVNKIHPRPQYVQFFAQEKTAVWRLGLEMFL